jgi:hypothetical protein
MVFLLAGGCSLEKPEAPSWDADLAVPLLSHHYDVYELIDRMAEDALSYDSLGNIALSFEQAIDTVAIDAGLSIESISDEYNHQLGSMAITSPEPLSLELVLTDYTPLSAGEIPETGFDADKSFDQVSEFQSATFDQADLVLTVTNYFDLNLDSLTIWIVNDLSADTLAEFFIEGGLLIGQTRIDTVSLAGQTASNQLSLASRIHTPGGTLLSTADKYLEIELGFGDEILVSSALAKVPAQEKDYTSSVSLNEAHRLTSANISSGELNLYIENTSSLSASLRIQVDEVTQDGIPLTINAEIAAGGVYNYNQNVAGYDLEPDLSGLAMAVNFDLNAEMPGSGDNIVEINSSDYFEVNAGISDLEFSQASGVIAPTVIEMPATNETIDLPKGMEDITLTDAVITLEIISEVDIPVEVSIDLTGDAGQYLNVLTDINGGTPQTPGVTHIVIDDPGTLTNPVPNNIEITGIATVGDGVTSGTVFSGSKVWGAAEITSPLKFAIGETEIEGDINSTDIDQDDIDEISDRLNSATIYATFTNHLPFGCEVELYLGGDEGTLYSDPQLTIGPVTVEGGTLNASGLVTDACISDIVIHLSETDLDIIENPVLYIGQRIILPGTNGQVVNIISSDYLDIDAYMQISARLGGEWD